MGHYKKYPPDPKTDVVLYTLKRTPGGIERDGRTVTFPRWVSVAYRPAFRLLVSGEGESGLGEIYRRYWQWWVNRKPECLRNLRQLDEAKQKWASDTMKVDCATPFAAHIIDYLPKRSMPKCPTGGEYRFNPVGTKPACSIHGYSD
jgi:hypothetical protein